MKIYKKVFKKFDSEKGLTLDHRPDYTAPKGNKHRVREELFKLKSEFGHEQVLHRMLAEEIQDDKPFKYPEEYQLADDALEKGMKTNFVAKPDDFKTKGPDFAAQQAAIDKYLVKDQLNLEDEKDRKKEQFAKEKKLEDWLWT